MTRSLFLNSDGSSGGETFCHHNKRCVMANYPINKIKKKHSYNPAEIADLFGINVKTVRRWIKDGLTPLLPHRRPLIMGAELHRFLIQKRQERRVTLKADEIYCLACRKAVKGIPESLKFEKTGKLVGRAGVEQKRKIGLCECCGKKISRLFQTPPREIN